MRIRLSLPPAYFTLPIELGYADDVIIVIAVLRGVVRAPGPGTDDGFAACARLTGLKRPRR